MPIVIETWESGEGEDGVENTTESLHFVVQLLPGETRSHGIAAIQSRVPDTLDGLAFSTIQIKPREGGIVEFEARYSNKEPKQPEQQPGEGQFSFDTTGGHEKIWYSRETLFAYGANDAVPPDFKGGINVSKSGVEGTDIVVPVFKFTIERTWAIGEVTGAMIRDWFLATGKTNDQDWTINYRGVTLTFLKGEVLFLGLRNSQKGTEKWNGVFSFEGIPNVNNLQIGDGTIGVDVGGGNYRIPSKRGHEYLWVHFEEAVDAATKTMVQRPVSAHIERVYESTNFANLRL